MVKLILDVFTKMLNMLFLAYRASDIFWPDNRLHLIWFLSEANILINIWSDERQAELSLRVVNKMTLCVCVCVYVYAFTR